jgi:hypothetical protein
MNQIQDEVYTQTLDRVRSLTPVQWARVQQRIRAVRARLPRELYLLAINATIDIELSATAPAPEPCRDNPVKASESAAVQPVCISPPPPLAPHYNDFQP